MALEHRGVVCELTSCDHDHTLIRTFRELSRTGDFVSAEVKMGQGVQYTFSWRALKPIDATCIVKTLSPKGNRTSVIAVVFMKSEHPETQSCNSKKFMQHTYGLVKLEYLRCPRNEGKDGLGGARLEIWKGCSPDISTGHPYITFDFNFIKKGDSSDSEYQDNPRSKRKEASRINRYARRIKTRSSAHEDTPLSATSDISGTQAESSGSNPIASSQRKSLASEPLDLPKMTLDNGASSLEIRRNSQLQSNDSAHELKESNDLLAERLEAETREIYEEERALELQAKQRDLEKRKQALNQERLDLELDAPAQKRQKLSE